MPTSKTPLHKHTLKLFEGDYERMQQHYPELGGALAIRKVVRHHLQKLEAAGPSTEGLALEIEEAE